MLATIVMTSFSLCGGHFYVLTNQVPPPSEAHLGHFIAQCCFVLALISACVAALIIWKARKR